MIEPTIHLEKRAKGNELCLLCENIDRVVCDVFDQRPEGETDFGIESGGTYHREIHKCCGCGHFYAVHNHNISELYKGQYLDANYVDADGLRSKAERILALPDEQSDNSGRVNRILQFAKSNNIESSNSEHSILDVGSGLCVFLGKIQRESSWSCFAIDADSRYLTHARSCFGVETHDSLGKARERGKLFSIVSWNKVLEHIENPVEALTESLELLSPSGFCYVEVPDGELAAEDRYDRSEFFIDHYHAFSASSLSMLIARSGARLQRLERVLDPSGKLSLVAFLKK